MKNSTGLTKLLTKAAVIAFWIGLWAIIAALINKEILIASPLQTVERLFELSRTSRFWVAALSSLARIFIGFAIGTVLGAVFGALSAAIPFLKELVSPVISVMRATPVASFILLALVWIKAVNVPTFIVVLIVFPIIFADVFTGIKAAPGELLEMANSFKVPKIRKIRYIYLQSVLPFFTSGCAAALGLAWKSGIAAEVLSTPKNSVGTMLNEAKIYIETPDLFALTAVVIMLSMLLEFVIMKAVKKGENIVITGRKNTEIRQIPHNSTNSSITSRKLSKSYNGKEVLKDFDITLKPGVTALMGESGSGKTTLLRVLAGLEEDDSGTKKAVCERPAVMFQEDRLLPNVSVAQNILFVNKYADVKKLLTALELEENENDLPSELSGGMCRRVALARTLAYGGDALFLDEPFKGLDAAMRERVSTNVMKIIGNTPTLLITHDEVNFARETIVLSF